MPHNEDMYKKAFTIDAKLVENYFKKIEKSEQQKFLEKLLQEVNINPHAKIADIGCGGGKLSYHLNQIYPQCQYYLLDYNEEAISIAKEINQDDNFHFTVGNIYAMPYEDNSFDITACLVVISFIEDAKKAVEELIRITKPNGRVIISALINFEHNVDLYTKVLDKTRESAKENLYLTYNTFATTTFQEWLTPLTKELKFYKFIPTIDFLYNGKGIDTYTLNSEKEKLQLAGECCSTGDLSIL